MLIKYNSFIQEQNERFEQRIVLQSIEETINMLRRRKEEAGNLINAAPDRKLVQLMKEKSKLRNALYTL